MSECWTQLRKSWVGFSLRLTRMAEAQLTSRKSGSAEEYVNFCMFLLLFSICVVHQGHRGRPVQTRRSRGRRRPSLCVHHGCQVDVHLWIWVSRYLYICIFVYLWICVFVFLCTCVSMYPVSGIGVNSGWLQFCGPLSWKNCQRHNRFRHWCLNYINNFHININVYC